ncbi:21436_t:CDS:2 [Gigaspora margarita]|uniref:21436_t:CDS:1 n=1 Tax=Gigaspora margarita TaxID=4874 RepID=A0ABM8W2Q5_GIGMA|nr:21436_t:CDS:2 [Gigaspora margarita]
MAKLQESSAKTIVGEDLMESNTLVSNLQTGTSLGHPISVLVDESNENRADGTEKENGLVAIESTKMDDLQSQLVQMQTSGTNASNMEAYDTDYRKYKKNKIALSETSILYNSTNINNNTNIISEQAMEKEYSDLDNNKTDTQIADLETLLQEEKDQDVSILDNNEVANKNIDNTQQETEFTLVFQFLRNKSITTSITQNNLLKELPSSTTPLYCNWISNKRVDILW